ncbi:LOW QUALITY PROTEIN: rho GTPase-activating protein 23-like, partial [Ascaphus truei]|uniref:LOW QUALITY PROTEIN: rho GTPase-activating protein 23-like n=1 Tax=Ascaphus truei TaxID=8439 RepID=UPI003F5A9450
STNSDSAKAKASRKETYARDILSIPFISAVNRKRKKRRDEKRFGSSTDDDSEQEAARAGQAEKEAEGPGEAPAPAPSPPAETGGEEPGASRWPGPERIPADSRSIVSGYSTLSTLCSEPASSVRGDEADDERSVLSHMETDREGRTREAGERPRSQDSFTSQRLIPGDTLARRRMGRGRPGAPEESATSPAQRPRQAAADDLCMAALRKPGSPETRRRKSAWRRHTVVLPGQLTDCNFNDWKEPPAGGSAAPDPGVRLSGGAWAASLADGRDSGLSSLESQKARAPASPEPAADRAPSQGVKSQNPPLQPGLRQYL